MMRKLVKISWKLPILRLQKVDFHNFLRGSKNLENYLKKEKLTLFQNIEHTFLWFSQLGKKY